MRLGTATALSLGLAGCALDGGRYPVLDVVHGPSCGRAGALAC